MKLFYIFLFSTVIFTNILSQTTCNPPFASAITFPDTIAKICKGDVVNFDASSSYAQTGFNIDKYYWDYDNGSGIDSTSGIHFSKIFNNDGVYKVQLKVKDDNNTERCISTNLVEMIVVVAPSPYFSPISSNISICLGDTVNLIANPDMYLDSVIGTPHLDITEVDHLIPDFVGSCKELTIDVESFLPNQQLLDINDLLDVYVNMEHSYLGDLKISITCPSGQSVIMYNQGGGGNYLGEPIDNGSQPGIGWDYGWSPNSTIGVINSNLPPSFGSVPSAIYESDSLLDSLIGCPLNGEWKLTICDLLASDDGYIFSWGLNFNNSLYPYGSIFDINIGASIDSSSWNPNSHSILSPDGNSLNVIPVSGGVETYTYTVLDSYGCINDTSVSINIVEPFQVNVNEVVCIGSTYIFPDGDTVLNINSLITDTSLISSVLGCDSTVITTLSIGLPDTVFIDSVICEGSSFMFPDGSTEYNIFNPTSNISYLSNIFGCDSIVNTSISLNLIDSTFIDTTICSGGYYTFPDGTFEDNIANEIINETNLVRLGQCDSVVITTVNVHTIDNSVTQTGIVLSANAVGYSYQWINCNDTSDTLIDANQAEYTPIINGNYAVEISNGICLDTSNCFPIFRVGTIDNKKYNIEYFPIPIKDVLTISLPQFENKINYTIYSVDGQLIKKGNEKDVKYFNIDFSSISNGTYILFVFNGNKIKTIKIIK